MAVIALALALALDLRSSFPRREAFVWICDESRRRWSRNETFGRGARFPRDPFPVPLFPFDVSFLPRRRLFPTSSSFHI